MSEAALLLVGLPMLDRVLATCHKTERYPGPAGWGLGLLNSTPQKDSQ